MSRRKPMSTRIRVLLKNHSLKVNRIHRAAPTSRKDGLVVFNPATAQSAAQGGSVSGVLVACKRWRGDGRAKMLARLDGEPRVWLLA